MNPRIKASLVSIVADIVLIATKGTLAFLSGSASLLADAYHSLSDLFVSFAVLTGAASRTWVEKKAKEKENSLQNESEQEPGEEERNSDEVTENQDVVEEKSPASTSEPSSAPGYWIEAGIAYLVSLIILYLPYEIISTVSTQKNHDLKYTWVAVVGVIVCIMIAYFISRYKMLVGRELDSPALVADGYHSRMDMFTSIAVLASLVGQMIGIRLDALMAVIIAVMIGIVGLELFITSIVGFIRKAGLKRLSLLTWIQQRMDAGLAVVSKKALGRTVEMSDLRLIERLTSGSLINRRRLALLFVLVLIGYFLGGLTMIRVGETGVKLRFGKIVQDDIPPGLTYRLPWPIESIERVRKQDVKRVEFGFRTADDIVGSISPTLWEATHIAKGYKKVKAESVSLTGDENIVDISLVMHYRPVDPVKAVFRVRSVDEVLRGLLESATRNVISIEKADKLFVEDRKGTLATIRQAVEKDVARLDLGVEILDVFCHDLHPPTEVVGAYRDVFSAREEKVRLLNKAETHRNESLPKARSDSLQNLYEAEAESFEKRERATGDSEKFRVTSEAYRRYPDLTAYRLFIEMAENSLTGKKKIIADPKVNRGGYRMWLFSPDKGGPFMGSSKGERL